MNSIFRSFFLTPFLFWLSWTGVLSAAEAVLETDTLRYVIGEDGKNISLFDKVGGHEYLEKDSPSFCALAKIGGAEYPADSAEFDGHLLRLSFAEEAITAAIKVTPSGGSLIFETAEVTGEPDELVFVNIPLTLEAKPYEPFAACALALTPFTHVRRFPALHDAYWAEAAARFGLVGAKAALVGVPQPDILPAIRRVMTDEAVDIPGSDRGGAWALSGSDGFGSYMLNFGTLTEETADSWIEACRRLGINQIECHGGRFFRFGSLDNVQPGGWDSFKKVIDRCHEAGIQVILLTYSCYINKDDRYVTPVPYPDLDTWRDWTLAGPIDAEADEITVNEPIPPEALVSGWESTSSRTLRLGDEIVEYSGATNEAPWKFLGCKRGFHETAAAPHDAGSTASLLKTYWGGLYVPKPDSALWYEIAKNHADLVNRYGFDGIYFDAIEGLQYMWGKENYWYYGGKFVMDVAKNLDRPVGMEFSGMVHFWWHYCSRSQAWDSAVRGFKRFLDIHLASTKAGEEYLHGCWLGHDPEIGKYGGMEAGGLYLPFHIGWWNLVTWGEPQCDQTYPDDIDYVGCKMVGNNAGFSFNHPITVREMDGNRLLGECAAMLHDYTEVRSAGLDESILARLREPGKEFKLYRDADGTPWFREMFYKKHKVTDPADPSAEWPVENGFGTQPLSVRVAALYTPAAYDDPAAAVRFDPKGVPAECEGNTGVTGTIELDAGTVPATGEAAFAFSARNSGEVPSDAAWVHTETCLMPAESDPSKLRATGMWVCGDGQGEVLNLQIGLYSQLVKIDFTGWKYIELLEADSSALSRYVWPAMGYTVYTHYRETGDLSSCRLWYNNIPAGKTVRCLIGPVRALPYAEYELKNPVVTVNGHSVTLPVTLESGTYAELRNGKCVKYDKYWTPLAETAPEGAVPTLAKGMNRIRVSAGVPVPTSARMEVTVIGEGETLR
ncbi:MAG: hypothetical protein IJG60_01105 [Thermoguttaceae bacterium]|nr:hypothetical protein [Thermoguttaceae bacterium]